MGDAERVKTNLIYRHAPGSAGVLFQTLLWTPQTVDHRMHLTASVFGTSKIQRKPFVIGDRAADQAILDSICHITFRIWQYPTTKMWQCQHLTLSQRWISNVVHKCTSGTLQRKNDRAREEGCSGICSREGEKELNSPVHVSTLPALHCLSPKQFLSLECKHWVLGGTQNGPCVS